MGQACSPHYLVGGVEAARQATGNDPFTEAERVKGLDAGQRAVYEMVMANLTQKKTKLGRSGYDILAENTKKDKAPFFLSFRSAEEPSKLLPPAFYNAVDKKLTAWHAAGHNPKQYREMVGNASKTLFESITSTIESARNPNELKVGLRKFGLTPDTAYDAKEYIHWISNGGPTQQVSENVKGLQSLFGRLAKADSTLNPVYALGNVLDLQRVLTHFATRRPQGVMDILTGIQAMRKAGNPLLKNPALEKAGLGHMQNNYTKMDTGLKWDPFNLTNNLQENLAFHIDKAQGGNGFDGVRDAVFVRKSWDRPVYDRSADLSVFFGLARFQISEATWMARQIKQVLEGDKKAISNVILYHAGRVALTGIKSIIPIFVYNNLPKDAKKSVDDADKAIGGGLVKESTGGHLDLAAYVQPGGGQLGARGSSLTGAISRTAGATVNAGIDLTKGNLLPASINVIAAYSAYRIISGRMELLKAAGIREDMIPDSTKLTKLYRELAKNFEGVYQDKAHAAKGLGKTVLGETYK